MVAGNGLVAKAFSSYKEQDPFIIFASGVSDSKSVNAAAFEKEFNMLKDLQLAEPEKTLVYFSTCSVDDPDLQSNHYITHKLRIEQYIKENCSRYYVFRVSNLVGSGGNPATIVNYLHNRIINSLHFDLWENAVRNILDIEDMFSIADQVIQKGELINRLVNIASPANYSTREIVTALESVTGMRANYTSVNKGTFFHIDTTMISDYLKQLHNSYDYTYLLSVIKKYYTA